jgi:Xaa-Pro aminopeptidase
MRRCQLADGIAMERFLYWLERSLQQDRRVSEWDAALQLGRYRAEDPDYLYDSFETISAWGPGAALPHYSTPRTGAPLLEPRGLFLCDSGGQYRCGTTDITRTVPLGACSELEREDYTLVLKGHIDLAKAVFPEGTPGCRLDALARAPLWAHYRNFGHGTGHGVGWFLGVHEGPQDIRQNLNPQALLPGMVVSDEPGIYREGLHGVRHENLLLCREAGCNDFGAWLRFETLTLCHYDTSILVTELLDRDEVIWLNEYNRRVFETLAPLLPAEVAAWLEEKTQPVVL